MSNHLLHSGGIKVRSDSRHIEADLGSIHNSKPVAVGSVMHVSSGKLPEPPSRTSTGAHPARFPGDCADASSRSASMAGFSGVEA